MVPERIWYRNTEFVSEGDAVTNNPPGEADTLSTVARLASQALPPGWSMRTRTNKARSSRRLAGMWDLRAPDGAVAVFAVEAMRNVQGRDLDRVLAQLTAVEGRPLLVAPYLSPTLRAMLADRGVSYADTTGNVRLVSDRPGLWVEQHGAAKDPWPPADVLQSLRGRAAGRALRALIDHRPPFGVRDLAGRARVPLGSLSRTLELLDREGLVTRDERRAVVELDWEAAIRRWIQDYDFTRSNSVSYFLEPRGLDAFVAKLTKLGVRYATTGASAAQRFTPIAPARQAAAYVDAPAVVADKLNLRRAETGANVVLAQPFDAVVFERTTSSDGLRLVGAGQLAADLLTGPGREPAEGNELLAWMHANEEDWRA